MVVRRVRKGPKRASKKPKQTTKTGPVELPARMALHRSGGGLIVSIYRTDRDHPHSLAIEFTLDAATVHNKQRCIVAYSTIRETMRNLVPKPKLSEEGRGKHRSKPRRIPGK